MNTRKNNQARGQDQNFNIIKRDLVDRVSGMEIQQAKTAEQLKFLTERMDNHGENQRTMNEEISKVMNEFQEQMLGDKKNPGYIERIRKLEEIETNRKERAGQIVTIAVGAATLAIGSALLWVVKAIVAFFRNS